MLARDSQQLPVQKYLPGSLPLRACSGFVASWGVLTRGLLPAAVASAGCVGIARTIASVSKIPDPAGNEVMREWVAPGETILNLPLDFGGSVQVTRHMCTEVKPPPGSLPASTQEWRVLAFTPAEGTTDLIQSVTKVVVDPPGNPEPRVTLRGEALPMHYTKTFVAVVLATMQVLGAPVVADPADASEQHLRILCIGLGGGSVPSFFTKGLRHCSVDVVELEPAVLQAATEGMGFVTGPRLRAHVEDGVDFALRAVESRLGSSDDGVYDAVLVDAYDAAGDVPMVLRSADGGLARALRTGLLRSNALVATNFLPQVDPRPALSAYRTALQERGASRSFFVESEGTFNLIAVQTCGGAPLLRSLSTEEFSQRLEDAAKMVEEATLCPFSMVELAGRCLVDCTPS